jgi:membrane associated rhomboid family serine protease
MPPPPPGVTDTCYRHPDVRTGVHCTRCGRPICTECMIQAPVGHQCPTCVSEAQQEFRRGPGRQIAVANAKGIGATKILLFLILGGFILEIAAGGAGSLMAGPNIRTLVRMGASVGLFQESPGAEVIGIAVGQWWRLLTAVFLHGGLLHLALNAYILWIFGTAVEGMLGRGLMLVVFVVTGIAGSAVSFAVDPFTVSVGASGAIFGVVGAFIAYNWRRRALAAASARIRALAPFLLINLIFSFAPGVDWRAHLGGLVAGVVAGVAAEGVGSRGVRTVSRVLGFAVVLGAAAALVAWRTQDLHERFPFL